jgi:hypothetical protein
MRRAVSLMTLFLLAACGFTHAEERPLPTATAFVLPQTTPVPTLDRVFHPVATPPPTASPLPSTCLEAQSRTRHTVSAEIDYLNRLVAVRQQVAYPNRAGVGLSQVVLNVKSNAAPGIFTLDGLRVNGAEAAAQLNGQRLSIQLEPPLKPGCSLTIELSFGLRLMPIDPAGRNAYRGYLGYSPRQMNLGHWLATVATRAGGEWITREDNSIGEQDVLDEADWDVTLAVKNAPEGLRVAAPGVMQDNQPGHWRLTLERARDFSLSLSDAFQVSGQRTSGGVKVELYAFEDARIQTQMGVLDSAAFALDTAVKSLEMYADLFGAYPYERLVLVQGDFPDGMEFSGIVFVGGEYFLRFNGPTSYLMIITAHEISHQWWYNKVANDQALDPWLDEALATYCEYIFIEEFYPALKDWWWDFRVNRLSPEGFVDSTVYEFPSRRAYINAVYLRGTRMLHDLRANLGTDAFFDWLRRYAETGTGRVMTPERFWALLTPAQLAATQATRDRYLRQPQIVVIAPEDF